MPPLTENRSTLQKAPGDRVEMMAANQTIFAGGIVMRNSVGLLAKGATAVGFFGVGRAEEAATSVAGAVTPLRFREGVFLYRNSGGGDLIIRTDVGTVCYIVDDETVAKTSATNTRSPAGIVEAVDANGVWVRFDEALTRAMLS